MKKLTTLILSVALVAPTILRAQDMEWFYDLQGELMNVIPTIITTLIALALLLFIFGLVRFIYHSGDENKVEEGKRMMVWGVIALFVLVSVWGLVALLQTIVGTPEVDQDAPQVINLY